MCVTMTHVMAVTVTQTRSSFHSPHEGETQDDSQSACKPRHSILGEFIPGEDLEECDVEESAGSQTLEDTNGEDMAARVLRLLVKGNNDPDEDADRSVEAQDDHVDDQL